MLIISTLLAVLLAGCDSDCCNNISQTSPKNTKKETSGDPVYITPTVNLLIPEAELNRQSNTQLPLDGADYSEDEDGIIKSYTWTFKKPDNTISTFSDQKPTFSFPQVGTYEICLSVEDDDQQKSNTSCRTVIVEDQPVYLKPEPIVTILDPRTKEPLPSQDHLIINTGKGIIISGKDSYDPDNLDSKDIINYRWKLIEYRKDDKGYFYKVHYCNWEGKPNHSTCNNLTSFEELFYVVHNGEIHRTVELVVEDQDFAEGKNESNSRVYEYDTNLYNGEDLTKIPMHPERKPTL
jgi:hypothetical protein